VSENKLFSTYIYMAILGGPFIINQLLFFWETHVDFTKRKDGLTRYNRGVQGGAPAQLRLLV